MHPEPKHGAPKSNRGREMSVLRQISIVASLLVAFLTLNLFVMAYFARIDAGGELDEVIDGSYLAGFMFASAFVLMCVGIFRGTTVRYFAIAVVAVLIWVSISAWLIWRANEQVRIRAGLPQQPFLSTFWLD